jgi:hypothetical protein
MKKLLSILVIGLLSIGLVACGQNKPEDAVKGFLTSFQQGDLKKAGTYVKDGLNRKTFDSKKQEIDEEILKAITNGYKFEDIKVVSNKGDKAKVEVKITSVDYTDAFTKTLSEIMPMAFATAFSDGGQGNSDKAIEKLTEKTIIKHLTSKDASFVTRNVTLSLEKNKDGEYKIVPDDNFMEAILANSNELNDMFDGNSNN